MMHRGRIVVLLIANLVVACQPSPKADLSGRDSPSGINPRPVVAERTSLDIAAAEVTNDKGALVLLKMLDGALPAAAVVVRHRPAEASSTSEGCSLTIAEEVGGRPAVVASNEHLLACSHALSVDGTQDSISVEVKGPGAIAVSEQLENGNSSFKLERHASGEWFVTEVKFNRSENNLETGYVDVVSETVAYPLNAKRLPVSDYEYDKVRHDLVKTVIE